MTDDPRPVEGRCGFTIIDKDGLEQPCDRPATGWRWYQDCDHEDTLDVACDRHENEGGRRLAAADRENAELRELLGIEKWSRDIGPANIREVAATAVRRIVAAERDDLRAQLAAAQAQLAEAVARNERLGLTAIEANARLEAVRALHYAFEHPRGAGRKICIEDEQHWPCDTDLALSAALSAAPQPEPETVIGCACGHTCDHGPHDQELDHDPEPPASDEPDDQSDSPNVGSPADEAASDEPARNPCTCDRAKEGAAFHHPTCPSYIGDEPARCEHGERARHWFGGPDDDSDWCDGPAASGTPDGVS